MIASDAKMDELQRTVVALCETHLAQRADQLSAGQKKLLQTVFGENLLHSNSVRNKLVRQKQLIVFLLNEVVLVLLKISLGDAGT